MSSSGPASGTGCRRCASGSARGAPRSSSGCRGAERGRERDARISLREVREGGDGPADLLRPSDEARLRRGRRSDGGERVLDRGGGAGGAHGLEEALADPEQLEPPVLLVA